MIDNYYIAEQFSLLSKLMDIHADNSFKSKSYSIAAFNIEKLPVQLSDLSFDKISALKGFGESTARKVTEIVQTGQLKQLDEYIEKTPPGVIEMLNIKGIGPKKICTIWKEMGLESIGELLYACNENRLLNYKGFGAKTQEAVKESIEFYQRSQGSHLYAEVELYALDVHRKVTDQFPDEKFELTGEFRRQLEVINKLEWITTCQPVQLQLFFEANGFNTEDQQAAFIAFKGEENILLSFQYAEEAAFYETLFSTSASEEFLNQCKASFGENSLQNIRSEEEAFSNQKLFYIPACMREKGRIISKFQSGTPQVIVPSDINALIHCHSKWSDGLNSIEEMANACIERGWEFMVISDHSKNAAYANGLTEDRIKAQHQQIEELNEKLKPFRIFKSIECDILGDGNLDYSNNILSTFDLVITSVHSNLKMTEEKAMSRILRALENPYTTIMGHLTGRLLLSRQGYPVDHEKIIEACARYKVALELNAHPRRLDMSWQWIDLALDAGVYISIDPDAHSIDAYDDVKYGTLAAQKGGLTRDKNLSSFSLRQFEDYLRERKAARGI
ncbi:MAG TPA: helix-hairpin-helix domain-containing protein [Chitinophagaceae bacterium]|nr:helix-hairpin-helix domain-containing protein [Chitinophagaceae bacterium]